MRNSFIIIICILIVVTIFPSSACNKLSGAVENLIVNIPTHLPDDGVTPIISDNTEEPTPTESIDITLEPSPGTDEPTSTPDGTEQPAIRLAIENDGVVAQNTMPMDLYGLSSYECENWFKDAVFIGDSITQGWKNYNTRQLKENSRYFGNVDFFCIGSFGVWHALSDVTENSIHPSYDGEKYSIEDYLNMTETKKAFICLGINDISIFGVDDTVNNYSRLIDRIREKCPDIEIFIVSITYMYRGSEREVLNNENILAINKKLCKLCEEEGLEFVNIASHLINKNGYIKKSYSSDHYVHLTDEAYAVWADVLRGVAARHIKGVEAPIFE